jgi:hypothetical protein
MKKSLLRMTAAIALIIGVPLGLFSAGAYGIISPRELGIGMVAWFATLFLWAAVVKLMAKNSASTVTSESPVDDGGRRRINREIWVRKIWIGVLVVLFPVGIVSGATHHAWLPMLTGALISSLWIYVTARQIGQRRRRLGNS